MPFMVSFRRLRKQKRRIVFLIQVLHAEPCIVMLVNERGFVKMKRTGPRSKYVRHLPDCSNVQGSLHIKVGE